MDNRQQKLYEFVKEAHGDQLRKYTELPYITHLIAVAEKVLPYANKYPLIWEVAICHDLFEDTKVDFQKLMYGLGKAGYFSNDAYEITYCVFELTDQFTSEDYPDMNRTFRKQLEVKKLSKISELSQTVKYADLIDNTSSIVDHDHEFAKVYLMEKDMYLKAMNKGEWDLFVEAVYNLYLCKKELGLL